MYEFIINYASLLDKLEKAEVNSRINRTQNQKLKGIHKKSVIKLSPIKNRILDIKERLNKMKVMSNQQNNTIKINKKDKNSKFSDNRKKIVIPEANRGETIELSDRTRELLTMARNQNSILQKLHNEKKILIDRFLKNLVNEFRENNNFQKVLLHFHEKKVDDLLYFTFKLSDVKKFKKKFMQYGKFTSQNKN